MKPMMKYFLTMFFMLFLIKTYAQKTVTIGSETLNPRAVLTLVAPDGDQGFILPVVSDRSNITPGVEDKGMMVYEESNQKIFFWNGTDWYPLGSSVNLDTTSINALSDVEATGAPVGYTLKWDGNAWSPANDLDEQTAEQVPFDNTFSGLGSTNVQEALDALSSSSTITQWTLDSTSIYFNKDNVGIGLNEPTAKLHVVLDSLDTLTTKGLVIENSSPNTSSTLYGSQLRVEGPGVNSKIGEYISIENGSGSKVGQGIIVKQDANQTTYGQNIQVSGTSDAITVGTYMTNYVSGAGDKYGILAGVGNGDGNNTGLYSYVNGGTGNGMGIRSLIENTAAEGIGIYSEISNTTNTSSKGFHSKILDGGTMVGFESEIVQDNDILRSYGMKSDIVNNASQAETYGVHSTISGAGPGEVIGLFSELSGTGAGSKYGLQSRVSGGAGVKTGVSSQVSQNGNAEGYGFYANVQSPTTADAFGTFHTMTENTGGFKYGTFSLMEGENNAALTGSNVRLTHIGGGSSVGHKSELYGSSTGNKTGFHSEISSGDATKTGYRSNITVDHRNPTFGFYSLITDNYTGGLPGQVGVCGLRLEVINNSEQVPYGIISSGDELNLFDGTISTQGDLQTKHWILSENLDNSYSLELIFTGAETPYVAGYFGTTGSYYAVSDKRLKKNVSDLEPVLEKVMRLKPSRYKFKVESGLGDQLGFIAQEVRAYFPELVSTSAGNGYEDLHTVNYDGFGALAIKAIQEQQEVIESQAEKIASLEERLAKLEAYLTK